MNPYASPAEPPISERRAPLVVPLALLASLMLLFQVAPWIWEGGIIYVPEDYSTRSKLLLVASAVVAIAGIATFSTLGAKLSRAICISQLVVTGTMLPILLRLRWDMQYTYMLPTLLSFACVDLFLLHFAIRRFERTRPLAYWTLALMVIVDAGIIVVAASDTDRYAKLPWFIALAILMGVQLGQGTVCVLMAIRLLRIR